MKTKLVEKYTRIKIKLVQKNTRMKIKLMQKNTRPKSVDGKYLLFLKKVF